jgi:hypothetical protein
MAKELVRSVDEMDDHDSRTRLAGGGASVTRGPVWIMIQTAPWRAF